MDRKKRKPSGTTESRDTVFVRLVSKGLPPDSPEFQARANRPLSERAPNLALYHELQKENAEQQLPKPAGEQPPPE